MRKPETPEQQLGIDYHHCGQSRMSRSQRLDIPSGNYLDSGVMRTCYFRAEKRNHLPVDGGQIGRLATADPVAVSDHFPVYPLAAAIGEGKQGGGGRVGT